MTPEPKSLEEVIRDLQPRHPVVTPPVLEPLWTVTDLSTTRKIARSTIYEWVQQHFIPHVRLQGCIRFRPSEVRAWLDEHTFPGRAQ
jgi:excisionase family DNA binding protein